MASFCLKPNWSSVCCGVGTGLLTSLSVSIIINSENDARLKKKLDKDKHFILNDIVNSSKAVYIDLIYRINEYIMFKNDSQKSIYGVYDNFQPVTEFCERLNKMNLSEMDVTERQLVERMLNIGSYRIDHFISELKRLPKQEYYLSGLLTREECVVLTSNNTNDRYLEYAEHIDEFWKDKIIDSTFCPEKLAEKPDKTIK